jgi:hypothetical protein
MKKVSFAQRLLNIIGRGPVTADDGTALVELAVVPLASGPLLADSLRRNGFHVVGEETFNVVTSVLSDYRILVPRSELSAAQAYSETVLDVP